MVHYVGFPPCHVLRQENAKTAEMGQMVFTVKLALKVTMVIPDLKRTYHAVSVPAQI